MTARIPLFFPLDFRWGGINLSCTDIKTHLENLFAACLLYSLETVFTTECYHEQFIPCIITFFDEARSLCQRDNCGIPPASTRKNFGLVLRINLFFICQIKGYLSPAKWQWFPAQIRKLHSVVVEPGKGESREYELITEAHAQLSVVWNCSRSSLPVYSIWGRVNSWRAGGGQRFTDWP